METFEVKRGIVKSVGGNAGLAKLATEYFENVEVDADGNFTASYGIMTKVSGVYTEEGKLKVDVNQLAGKDLSEYLAAEGGREKAMESRKRWSSFLDETTG